MQHFLQEFEKKVDLAIAKKSNDWTSIYRETLAKKSLQSISNYCIGEKLCDEMLEAVGQEVREKLYKILEEAVKYARQSRSPLVQIEHVQYGMQVEGVSLNLWHLDYKWPVLEDEEELETDHTDSNEQQQAAEIKFTGLKSPLESLKPTEKQLVMPKGIPNSWVKREQVLLMANRKFPLSKEQQKFYVLITESIMGSSETLRREALRSVSSDSSLQPMLSKLCLFIAEGVKVNVLQNNISLLFYLLRLVRCLLGNSSIRLNNYLHLLIPAVISCVVSRQICKFPTVQNHWGVRDFASNLAAEIVKFFNNQENNIFSRIIRLYNNGLFASSLTTVYGSVLGLQKLGKFPIYEYVIPQLPALSVRIEPYLKEGANGDQLNKQAAIFIRYRLLKMCTPIVKTLHNPPDEMEKYVKTYGFLGGALCYAVTIERIACNVKQQINENAKCNCKCNE